MSSDDGIDLDALAEAYNAGLEAERAGRREAAVAAYRAALAIDPRDPGGVAIRLAVLGAGEAPAAAPPAYVATLFDQTAERFEDILVDGLGYGVPAMLPGLLDRAGAGRAARLLDLGCGTGLVAEHLADRADHLTGCDLSEEMVARAWDKALYDALYVAEAVAFLESGEEAPFDLIVAADVLPYLGDLDALLAGVAAGLSPGGVFAASTESLPQESVERRGWALGPRHRYAHAPGYVAGRLAAHGMAAIETAPITVREEDGAPVPGHLLLARRG